MVVLVRAVPCCGDYLVGRWYGPRALGWLTRRGPGRLVTALQRVSARGGGVLLVAYPGATASVLAGANRLPGRRFLPLMVLGVVLGALVSRLLAAAAPGPVTAVATFVDRYALAVGAGLLTVAVLGTLLPRARRPTR